AAATRVLSQSNFKFSRPLQSTTYSAPFGVAYIILGTIQRRLAWPLHKDDTLNQSGRASALNIYFAFVILTIFLQCAEPIQRSVVLACNRNL
ncbi:hypothetical protein SISSUDRAFT_1004784, partial [Sistotremastrum suecicum HHB10207 ss-3]